jgi:uncharacterized protein YjbI with pentapeptide repeats
MIGDFMNQVDLVQDGTTSVALDTKLLESSAGLTLSGSENTVAPVNEKFAVGFDITDTSDFLFSNADGFTPVAGEIEHTGTITFNSGAGHITVGDFSIGFDASRTTEDTSGFFIENTVEGVLPDGAVLFDIGNPESLEAGGGNLSIDNANLLVAPEFADTLVETKLAASDLTGADVGDANIQGVTENQIKDNVSLAQVKDGTTSVGLDTALLESAAGLTLSGSENTVDPVSGEFAVGFDITEKSDFSFSDVDGFTPVDGEIEHTGTITFNSGAGHITVGDFSIGFDASRTTEDTSGFFIENTVEGVLPDGAVLFDIGNPESLEAGGGNLSIDNANLLVAPEFADTLVETKLAASDLTGADVGDANIQGVTENQTKDNVSLAQVKDGTTSIGLDTALLESAAGLTLSGSENTVDPVSGEFAVGFDITEKSDFLFSNADCFTPVAGEIEHTGTITFNSGAGDITVGDFSIGFDASRTTEDTSGFFVENTVEGVLPDGAVLFDVGNPESLEAGDGTLSLGTADLLVAPEFSDTLVGTGLAASDLTGADIGDVAVNADTMSL